MHVLCDFTRSWAKNKIKKVVTLNHPTLKYSSEIEFKTGNISEHKYIPRYIHVALFSIIIHYFTSIGNTPTNSKCVDIFITQW